MAHVSQKSPQRLNRRKFFALVCLLVGGRATRFGQRRPMFTPEEIAEAERAANSPGPWYTTKEVLEYLKSLETEEKRARQIA
jgi:hypothetical protein